LSQFNYFGPRNFGVFTSYYTETLLYSNFRSPLFLRTCQAREIHQIKGTRKNGFYSNSMKWKFQPRAYMCTWNCTIFSGRNVHSSCWQHWSPLSPFSNTWWFVDA